MSTSTPVAIVLGAGMGGRGVSLALAGRAHVIVVDRDETLAEAAAQAVIAAGGTAEASTVNLLDFDAVEAFRDDLLDRHGRIDAVVHLVGGWQGSKTVDRKAAEQFAALEPGIFGTLRIASAVFREALIAAPSGRFFILSSVQAQSPSAGNAAYASIKAATETWTKALGASFADTPARAVILAVNALVNDEMRARNPDKAFTTFTDTSVVGATVADLMADPAVENGARIVLVPQG
ncbi:MAG TPA: SDR family oxidoreductase [Actinomycetota bacterium]|nr:SDR family oxidoreductase [Actinomycetota bacterium]HRV67334.1 SDR family oxidoreductase [Candidatus Nanopelagicales bacterium]